MTGLRRTFRSGARGAFRGRFDARRFADDRGQTVGIYIVAMAALFFLAFAYFAVGQATVTRNSAQTAADAAALAAARDYRDQVKDAFLSDLTSGDLKGLGQLLGLTGEGGDPTAQSAAARYADANDATLTGFVPQFRDVPTFSVTVQTKGTVGPSVIDSTKDRHAVAKATAVVEPRCSLDDQGLGNTPTPTGPTATPTATPTGNEPIGGQTGGDNGGKGKIVGPVHLTCDNNPFTVDPTPVDFTLNLSDFYSVHLITDELPNQ